MKNALAAFVYASLLALSAFLYYEYTEAAKLAAANKVLADSYARANGRELGYRAVKKDLKLFLYVEEEIGTPRFLIQAVKAHENTNCIMELAVNKIPAAVVKRDPPEQWQPRGASKIMVEEAFSFILSDKKLATLYFQKLGARYCDIDKKDWSAEVERLYYQFKKAATR